MRTSTLLVALLVLAVSSLGAIAINQGQIYTVTPPRPAPYVGLAAASPSDYAPLLRMYCLSGIASPGIHTSPLEGNSARTKRLGFGWPMRGHDPANTGHTAALGPAVQTQPAWVFQPDASTYVWRPAVARDGTIYVTTVSFPPGGVDGRLYALHPDGSVKWQTELTNSNGTKVWSSATPVLDEEGNIYVVWAHDVDGGNLTALSLASTGEVRWLFEPKIPLENASHAQPVLGDGVLYAAMDTSFFSGDSTQRAAIFALDVATGYPAWRWNSPNPDTFFDGPAIGHDGHIYQASASNPLRGASGHLYRIRPQGELDWSVDIGAGVNAAPVIDAKNNVYLGDLAGVALKYNSAGVQLWAYDTLSGQIYMSPVLHAGRVTVGAANAGLHVLDVHTGTLKEVFAPSEFPLNQASDQAGNSFFYTFNGTVFGFGREGRQWWTFDTGTGSSVNAIAIATDGKLLVSNSQSLVAYVAPVLGDLNCDGAVNAFDREPYALALADPAGYAQRYPQCHQSLADVNGDGAVNAFDTIFFVRLLDRRKQ